MYGGTGNDNIQDDAVGTDKAYGDDGDDTITFSNDGSNLLTDADTVDGGAGNDTLNYWTNSGTLAATDWNGVTNVETILVNGYGAANITAGLRPLPRFHQPGHRRQRHERKRHAHLQRLLGGGWLAHHHGFGPGRHPARRLGQRHLKRRLGQRLFGWQRRQRHPERRPGHRHGKCHGTVGAAVTVNLGTGTASDGSGGTDTLSGIENIKGSMSYGDTLTGDSGNNTIEGFGGADTINGGQGADIITGGLGGDSITGGGAESCRPYQATATSYTDLIDVANYLDITSGGITASFNPTSFTVSVAGGDSDMLYGISGLVGTNQPTRSPARPPPTSTISRARRQRHLQRGSGPRPAGRLRFRRVQLEVF